MTTAPLRLAKVPFFALLPDVSADGRAADLLQLAASRGWLTSPEALSLVAEGRREGIKAHCVLAPAGWHAEDAVGGAAPVRTYESVADLAAQTVSEVPEGGWLGIRNGRYAVEVDGALLEEALQEAGIQALAVTVDPGHRAYAEKLRVGAEGRVFGFRRLYRSESVPAALPPDWPHLLFLRKGAVEARDGERPLSASFAEVVSQWRTRGVPVRSVVAGGLLWDLGSPEGLLAFFRRTVEGEGGRRQTWGRNAGEVSSRARLYGAVTVESDVRVEDGAIIIGPSFLGRGTHVGPNALVQRSILGPGTEIASGEAVRDQIVSPSFRFTGGSGKRVDAPLRSGAGDGFRCWPWFSYARLGKRLIDVAGSLLALGLSAPIFVIVAVAIKLNSKGPVFYIHRRQGRYGREFGCIKFRTMVSQAHQLQEEMRAMSDVDGPQFKVVDDPRVTLVGSFLRETNLDEVPQFINVLLGQMSIVGPRPSPDQENQMCPAWREARLSVRPGITGLWQVSHSRVRTNDFQEWIGYDTQYVRRLSLGLDLLITAKTVRILLAGFARLFLSPRQEWYPEDGEPTPRDEHGLEAGQDGAAAHNGMGSRQRGVVGVASPSSAEARDGAFDGVNPTVRKGY